MTRPPRSERPRPALEALTLRAAIGLYRLLTRRPPIFLLAVNLLPVACVVLFGWGIGGLMLCYWAENVIIGLFTIPRMIAAGVADGASGIASAVFNLPLFVAHYGFFCLGHGFFLLALLAMVREHGHMPIPLSTLGDLARSHVGLWPSLAGMTLFHGKELMEWLRSGAARATTPIDEMIAPYARIGVLHLALMGGMMIVMILDEPLGAVVFLGLGKTVLELVQRHRRRVGT